MEVELQEQRGGELKVFYTTWGWFNIMHILYVGEGVRDFHCEEEFVTKVIPQNSIRLLNLIGEGMYVCLLQCGASPCMTAKFINTYTCAKGVCVCMCLSVSLVNFSALL